MLFDLLQDNPAQTDFIEYWAAFKIALDGGNPYNPKTLLATQKALGYIADTPLMMWNPPWLLIILFPILILPFQTSYQVFLIFNIFLLITSVNLLIKTFFPEAKFKTYFLLYLFCLISVPIYYNFFLAQLGVILLFAIVCLYIGLKNNETILTATGVLLTTVKPHLFYLIFLLLLWDFIRKKNYKLIIYSLIFFACFLVETLSIFNTAFLGWADIVQQKADLSGAILPGGWEVPTVVGKIRLLTNNFTVIPMIIIPSVIAMLSLFLILQNNTKSNWLNYFPIIICCSIYTSPFGWIFDYTALLILQLQLLSIAKSKNSFNFFYTSFFVFNLLALIYSIKNIRFHQDFFWYPTTIFLLSGVYYYKLKKTPDIS